MQASRLCIRSFLRCTKQVDRLSCVRVSAVNQTSCERSTIPILSRHYSMEPIPAPHPEGAEKHYSEKIQQIVNEISQLTLIEVADLNELLKKTLNISEAPVMSMGAMPMSAAAQVEEEVEEKAPVKMAFDVKLVKFDEKKKVALIKQIKSLVEGMNLVQAKKFVESAPQKVKTDVPKDEAEKLKEALEEAGATIEIV